MKHRSRWLFVLLGVALMLAGCSGSRTVPSITAYSLFSHTSFSLPIKGYNAEVGVLTTQGYITFTSKKSLSEMYEMIADQTELTLEQTEQAILIKQKQDSYINHYCLRKGSEGRYVFSGMRGKLITDIDSNGNKVRMVLLLPVHLITDSLIIESSDPYSLYPDIEYEMRGSMDDLEQFYKESGWYDVTREGDTLVLSGYRNPQDIVPGELDSPTSSGGTLEMNSPYYIRFCTKGAKSFFSVSRG